MDWYTGILSKYINYYEKTQLHFITFHESFIENLFSSILPKIKTYSYMYFPNLLINNQEKIYKRKEKLVSPWLRSKSCFYQKLVSSNSTWGKNSLFSNFTPRHQVSITFTLFMLSVFLFFSFYYNSISVKQTFISIRLKNII